MWRCWAGSPPKFMTQSNLAGVFCLARSFPWDASCIWNMYRTLCFSTTNLNTPQSAMERNAPPLPPPKKKNGTPFKVTKLIVFPSISRQDTDIPLSPLAITPSTTQRINCSCCSGRSCNSPEGRPTSMLSTAASSVSTVSDKVAKNSKRRSMTHKWRSILLAKLR